MNVKEIMTYTDAPHWDWGKMSCAKHADEAVPCGTCETNNETETSTHHGYELGESASS